MKKKTPKLIQFIEGLHESITLQSRLLSEATISSRAEVRDIIGGLIGKYLVQYFLEDGYKNVITRADYALYWEGKESEDEDQQSPVFGQIVHPDFVINDPYLIAIVYKQGIDASELKLGISESLIYSLSGEFDFVYFLFQDQTQDKKIKRSVNYKLESSIVAEMWDRFNVFIRLI